MPIDPHNLGPVSSSYMAQRGLRRWNVIDYTRDHTREGEHMPLVWGSGPEQPVKWSEAVSWAIIVTSSAVLLADMVGLLREWLK